jgi:hypothetical protein
MHVYRLLYIDDGSTAGRLFCSVTARRDQAGTWVANSGLFRSDDGGLNWTHITAGANVRYAADYAVSSSDPNTIYLCSLNRAGADGALYRTTNGLAGAPTWTTVFDINSIPQKGGVRRYWPYLGCFSVTVDPAHSSNVFLLTATHGIWLSRAAGDPGTWQEFRAIPFLSTHRMVVTDVGLGLWGADESVYVTTFGAGVWSVGIEWWWRSWFCQWRWWNWLCRWLWRCWCWPWYWERPIRWLGWPPWPWQTRGTSPRGT